MDAVGNVKLYLSWCVCILWMKVVKFTDQLIPKVHCAPAAKRCCCHSCRRRLSRSQAYFRRGAPKGSFVLSKGRPTEARPLDSNLARYRP